MHKQLRHLSLFLFVVAAGCGKSAVETTPQATTSGTPVQVAHAEAGNRGLPVDQNSTPDAVVTAFLDAMREGDDHVTEALLTQVARVETKKHDLVVQPPGSPSARYQVGEVRHVQGGAHVDSQWREHESTDDPVVYDIVWVLRREPEGWRVAGMATALNPRKPPVFLNFEDVPDLMHKWQASDEELTAEADAAAALQAAQPADTITR